MGIWYRDGTVSVVNNTTAVTGVTTAWLAYVRPGDAIRIGSDYLTYEVASIEGNTALTLATPYLGTTVIGAAYEINPSSYRHQIPSDILETMRQLVAGQTDLIETSGPPSPSLGADKSLAFDPAARVYYYKVNGVWGDPVSLGGADGVDAGFKNQFSTSTGMSDPGNGFVRFNSATRASVTAIAIADRTADAANPDVSNYILTWDDATSPVRGTIIFRKVGAALNFAIFQITGVSVDNTGWTQLTVTHVASGGTFAASDDLSTVFVRAGDRGAAGIDGVSAGPLFALSTNTTIADPDPGTLRFNNASLPSATLMAIDATSAAPGNPDIRPFILTWDDSTNSAHRGVLTFTKLGAQENFAIFAITGALVDNTGWLQLSLAYVSGGGTLGNGDVLVVQFDRTGNKGADGLSAGFQYAFSTTTTIADPGAGGLRLNNATLSAVTALAVSSNSAETGNPSIAGSIATWGQSTNLANRGVLTLRKLTAPQNFAQYFVNSDLTANSGWSNVPVTHLSSNGSFSNADVLTVEFTRTGNNGIDGTNGTDGVTFVWKGNYSGATAYVANDVVRDNNSSWIALLATTGNAPPTLPTTINTYWELVAAKGTDGAGTGDVVGPASSIEDYIAVFDGTTGKLLKSGGQTIANAISTAAASALATVRDSVAGAFDTLAEIATELALKAYASLTLTAGGGLTGGGDLSSNRTFAVGAGTGMVVNADDVAIDKASDANVRAAASNKVLTSDLVETASAFVALTDTAPVAVDWDAGINFSLTVTANRAIGNPTNGQPGTWRTIYVIGNDATNRTITFGNQFLGEVPQITNCDSGRAYLLMIFCVTTSHFVVSSKRASG